MNMNKKIFLALVFVGLISICAVHETKSQSSSAIFINADGTISGTDLIQRNGNLYRLGGDLHNSPIVVECNNIVLDGAGFTLQGTGGWPTPPAINLTCSNVTVRNFKILKWEVGILGAYNGNIISNCNVTGCERGIAIYADGYNVTGNYVASNWNIGIRIQGNNNIISQNQILNNAKGFFITNSTGNMIIANKIESNGGAVSTDYGGFVIYHNNFIDQTVGSDGSWSAMVLDTAYYGQLANVTIPPWDDGYPSGGNYWSDYVSRYPNASEIGDSGIGDTAYLIGIECAINSTTVNSYVVEAIDRYPLLAPVNISEPITISSIPTPSPTPLQSPSPPPSPSPTPSPSPSTSPTPSLSPSTSLSPTPSYSASEQPSPTPAPQSAALPMEFVYVTAGAAVVILAAVAVMLRRRK
jgi:parallel beta-helix repeat protein